MFDNINISTIHSKKFLILQSYNANNVALVFKIIFFTNGLFKLN